MTIRGLTRPNHVHAAALSLLRIALAVAGLALAGAAVITQPVLGSYTFTAYLRNPNYHTRNDTAGTLDYVRMARVVDGVYSAVMHTSH